MTMTESLDALERQLDRLLSDRDVLLAAVAEALEYFQDRADVDGEQKPNMEMRMAETMRRAILRATK